MATTTNQLKSYLDFITWSAKLREVTRHNNATTARKESIAEHSWHVALICWILSQEFEKEFDTHLSTEKMLKMSLIHDLVEIDAGDPSVWDKNHMDGKAEREEAVAQTRFNKLDTGLAEELLALWHEYEQGETLEAKIVRGVDRLNPAIMRYLTGQGWSDIEGSTQSLDAIQLPKINFSKALSEIYEQIKTESVSQGLLGS